MTFFKVRSHYISALILLLFASSAAFSQSKVPLYGRLFSPQENKGIAYGTVAAFGKDSVPIAGALCDSLGFFEIKLPAGKNTLRCSAMGYITKDFTLSIYKRNGSKGEVFNLQLDSVAIEAVKIKGGKSFVTLKPNRKVVTLSANDINSGRELTEILTRLPDFEGSLGGALLLRGKPFQLLINGHPTGEGSTALNTLNMKDIASIEVITTPMAKYRAQSSGGIVNVILKRPSLGINAVIQANAGLNQSYNLSIAGNVRIKKVNFFAGALGSIDFGRTTLTAKTFDSQKKLIQNVVQEEKDRMFSIRPKLGFDYYITKSDVLTSFYTIQYSPSPSSVSYRSDSLSKINEYEIQERTTYLTHLFTTTYSHEFDREDTDINFSINLNYYGTPLRIKEFKDNSSTFFGYRDFVSKDYNSSLMNSLDFRMPIIDKLMLESGLAADFSWGGDESGRQERLTENEEWRYTSKAHRAYNSQCMTLGAYSTLTYEIGKVTLSAGLRYEFFTNRINSSLTKLSEIYKRYHDLFGSGGISYLPMKGLSFSLNYSGRVYRPSPSDLIPVKLPSDFLNEFYIGSPDLRPAYSHQVEFSYSHSPGPVSLNADISWNYIKDDLTLGFTHKPNGSTVRRMTNLRYSSYLYMGGRISWSAAAWCWLSLSARVNRSDEVPYPESSGQSVKGNWSYRLGADVYFMYKKLGYLSLWGGYQSASKGTYRSFKHSIGVNAIIVWNINERWKVFVKGVNLAAHAFTYTTQFDDLHTDWRFDYHTRTVYLGVYFRIGKQFKSSSGEDVYTNQIATDRMK